MKTVKSVNRGHYNVAQSSERCRRRQIDSCEVFAVEDDDAAVARPDQCQGPRRRLHI